MYRLIFLILGSMFVATASAQQWSPLLTIEWVKVDHQSKLEVKFVSTVNATCTNGNLATMPSTHPNYPQVLAMVMTAITRPRKVYVGFESGCDTTSNTQRAKLTSLALTSTP